MFAGDRDVQCHMVPAELRRIHGVVGLGAPEDPQGVVFRAGGKVGVFSKRLIGAHDVENLLVALGAQQHLQHLHHGVALRGAQATKPQTRAWHIADREIRPHGLAVLLTNEGHLAAFATFEISGGCHWLSREGKLHLPTLLGAEAR